MHMSTDMLSGDILGTLSDPAARRSRTVGFAYDHCHTIALMSNISLPIHIMMHDNPAANGNCRGVAGRFIVPKHMATVSL